MKILIYLLIVCGLLIGCNANRTANTGSSNSDSTDIRNAVAQDTVRIANDNLEYEIIIIEPGFNFWLASTARPEGYYTQSYLENRNRIYVTEWNLRVLQPQRYNTSLYEMQINYEYGVDYGYDVNYQLYNYFIYFQLTYKQQLSGFVPRL